MHATGRVKARAWDACRGEIIGRTHRMGRTHRFAPTLCVVKILKYP